MTEYQIVYGWQQEEFEQKVMFHLNDGWELHGGVAISEDEDGIITFAQAMIFINGD